jgi:hypothetical protein
MLKIRIADTGSNCNGEAYQSVGEAEDCTYASTHDYS